MIKKLFSVFTAIVVIVCSLCVSSSAADNFTPVLRFVVASDVHIADSGSFKEESRLAKLFDVSYSYAESQSYKKIDGVFFAGDISDNGSSLSMEKFFNIVNENAQSETTVRAVLGNHEFYTDSSKTVSRFLTASGYSEADTDFVLGGYHFIMMCPQNGGKGYTSTQKSWLKKKLAADAKEDKTGAKPIFVFQHHAVSGTVYGSERWGIDDISDLLSNYPQVVDFSGHSHFPINDPRSIWQGTFTALNDGTLSYYEMGIAGVADSLIFPCDKQGGYATDSYHRDAAQYFIVEVDKNSAIRVKGYDLLSDTFICEYTIPSVGNTNNFIYTQSRKNSSAPPAFNSSASIALKGVRRDAAVFQIPQASGTDIVQHYRFDVYDLNNNLISTEYALSDTFYFPTPEALRCVVKGLQADTDYYVKCFAVNCWEKESEPLTLRFRTSNSPDNVTCYDSPVTPDIFSFIQCENGTAYDGVSGKMLSGNGEPIPYIDTLTGRCGAEFNGLNSYRFDGFKDKYETMRNNGVTFEYYGVFDDTDFQEGHSYVDLFSNQESGGCGLELNSDGTVDFYVNTGGKYTHPGGEIEFGKPVHIIGTYDGIFVRVYINGILANSERAIGTVAFPENENAQFLCVGGDSGYNGKTEANFTGKIVTANVYGRALSGSEISELYNQYDESCNTFDFIPESGYQFDCQNKILYGLDLTALTSQNIKNAFTNKNLFVETDETIGTGTKIFLKNSNNEIYDTAEVVIFGDVNGDGRYDGMDAIIVSCLANGLLNQNSVGKSAYTAADCNHDSVIDKSDVSILVQAGILLAGVDQSESPEELKTNSVYIMYLNIIEQTVDENAPSGSDEEQSCLKIIIDFISRISAFIKNLFNLIKSTFA